MSTTNTNRRQFLAATAFGGGILLAGRPTGQLFAQEKSRHKVERLGVGAIGLRYQGGVIAHKAQMYGDIVAVCDVEKNVRDPARAAFGSTPRDFGDYRDLLERKDIDIITIGTPDHWHTKMVIDACRAGKDVYFFDCVPSRKTPASDIESQHRSVSTCHLGNIAMRVGRKVNWDPQAEQFPGDAEANRLLSRQQRSGFETV